MEIREWRFSAAPFFSGFYARRMEKLPVLLPVSCLLHYYCDKEIGGFFFFHRMFRMASNGHFGFFVFIGEKKSSSMIQKTG